MLGPSRGTATFDKPVEKYLSRASAWGAAGVGLHLTLAAYAIYILPVLQFVIQLDRPPPHWPKMERIAMRKLLPGPGSWCHPRMLRGLHKLGFARGVPDLEVITTAAQHRVAHWEARRQGGLRVQPRARDIMESMRSSDHILRQVCWRTWLDNSFLLQLKRTLDSCKDAGITRTTVEDVIAKPHGRPFPEHVHARMARNWQKATRRLVQPDFLPDLWSFMRARLDRWPLDIHPRVRADRAMSVLPAISKLAPPRVLAAILRTLWNGWITARRMQQQVPRDRLHCCFGCHEIDDIAHYAHCSVVGDFARRHLGLIRDSTPTDRLANFLLLDRRVRGDQPARLLRQALRTAVVYHVHNTWRHSPGASASILRQAMPQVLREMLRGHQKAMATLAGHARIPLPPRIRQE